MPKDRAQLLLDASPTAILLLSPEGKVEELNRAARKVLAVQPDRIIGRPILARVVPDDRDRVREYFLRVLQGQECEWATRFKRGDAAIRVQRVRAVPLEEEGRPRGIVMFMRDMTEAREGRPETLQLQTLLENLPGQFVVSLDTRRRVRYSSGLARVHFRDDLGVVGSPFEELLNLEDSAADFTELCDAVTAGDHWSGMLWHRRVDGLSFPVRTFAVPHLDPRTGRVLGALVVGQDATAEHKWRERARAAEHLARIGELVASVAQEFDAGLARLSRVTEDPHTLQSELTRLSAFAAAIDDLAEHVALREERISLPGLASDVVETMAFRLAPLGISTTIEDADEVGDVFADRAQIEQVLRILVTNAIDNLVGIEDGELRIQLVTMPGHTVIRVTDSGPAIPEEALHRVFEPLFSSTHGKAGLGLSIARGIVHAHQGRMWVDLEDDGQPVFSVSLPLEGASPFPRFRPVPLVLGHDRSILVVDDEESVRLSLRRFLEKVGFEVREAWSGRSALAQITAARPPDLVLTDLRMSDGSGSWLLSQLWEDFPDLLRRTVVITGDPDRDDVSRLLQKTGCPVVSKPVDFPNLLEILDEVAHRVALNK